jgi:alpha-L-fucosidase 2
MADELVIWQDWPAEHWYDALPIGNGRLGAMVYGGQRVERIGLDEGTFWSGGASADNNPPNGPQRIAKIRQKLADGDAAGAQALSEEIIGRKLNYGTHLRLGNLRMVFDNSLEGMAEYRRELDLDSALASVGYTWYGITFRREVFASHPDQVLVVRLTCSQPAGLGLRLWLDGDEQPFEVRREGDDCLVMDCRARETTHSDGQTGVDGHVRLRVLADGGELSAVGTQLRVDRADAVTLLVAMGTTWNGADPVTQCRAQVDAAARKAYAELREAHLSDHRSLFRRAALDLGPSPHPDWPLWRRLAAARDGQDDAGLCALLFQFGCYMLMCSSRADSPLPAHLLGIWNDNVAARIGWTCDYHLDINTQMNYWIAERANLSECHQPLFRWISERLMPSGRHTARTLYGMPGWVAHVVANAWGYSAPGWSTYWGIFPTGGVWTATHLWEHYRYTGDCQFLAETAYPVLREAAEFCLEYLSRDPATGWLVGGPASSPENTYRLGDGTYTVCMSPTVDRVLLEELFRDCIEAARTLGCDAELAQRIESALGALPPYQVGRYGQLQEWLADHEEAIPGHRHTSHLLGLFPYDQITPVDTPELARAARVSMERRQAADGYEEGSWARNNLTLFYARLEDGAAAYRSLTTLFREECEDSLMANRLGGRLRPYEMDFNTGAAAGIAEMLLQSKRGAIHLLPALPPAWPQGQARGLCAHGGFEVDLRWSGGRLQQAQIRAGLDGPCQVCTAEQISITCDGEAVAVRRAGPQTWKFQASAGHTYEVRTADGG